MHERSAPPAPPASWDGVAAEVLHWPARRDLRIPKSAVPHPSDVGMKRSVGVPHGSWKHYRAPLSGKAGLHVREYDDHYTAHWDERDPLRSPVAHLWHDLPHLRPAYVGSLALAATLALVGL